MKKNSRIQVGLWHNASPWRTVLDVENLVFSGGEVQTRLTGGSYDVESVKSAQVIARIQSSDDFITLLHVFDVLRSMTSCVPIHLVIPYFPYARQDRRMVDREAFSLRVAAKLVNDLKADSVTICDPHSDVAPALIERVRVIKQVDLVKKCAFLDIAVKPVLVAPDAGAAKKTAEVAKAYGLEYVVAHKVRDVNKGAILKTELSNAEIVHDRSVVMIDDICDGGRTFIELGKVLREAGANMVSLYVTHGIFSKGIDPFVGILDDIYTTDSFQHGVLSKSFPLYTQRLEFGPSGSLA